MTDGPFRSAAAGCGAYVDRNPLHPRPCQTEPVWAGLVYAPYPRPGVTSWAFTCDLHKDRLVGARTLLERDRVELERRRTAWQAGLDGQEWVPTEAVGDRACGAGTHPESEGDNVKLLNELLGDPKVRNRLGLHSQTNCMRPAADQLGASFMAGIRGEDAPEPPPWSCGCSCRRCRKAHRPDSPPGLVLREEVSAALWVQEMRRSAVELGIEDMFSPIPHDDDCDVCAERRRQA